MSGHTVRLHTIIRILTFDSFEQEYEPHQSIEQRAVKIRNYLLQDISRHPNDKVKGKEQK
jgi:F0F1-type ATP synthase beta subunit